MIPSITPLEPETLYPNLHPEWRPLDFPPGWKKNSDNGITSLLVRHADRWRLICLDTWRIPGGAPSLIDANDLPVHAFESEKIEDCIAFSDFLDGYRKSLNAWTALSFNTSRPIPEAPEYSLRAVKFSDTPIAIVFVVRNEEICGQLRFQHSGPDTCYIAGSMTASGHSSLNTKLIGQGFGRAMYDCAEEVSGMTLVPSGRDYSPGALSAYSQKFWEKRIATQGSPMLGSAADERRSFIDSGRRLAHIEKQQATNPAFLIALAEVTGGQLIGQIDQQGGKKKLAYLWVETPSGYRINETGILSLADAQNIASEGLSENGILECGLLSIDSLAEAIHGSGLFFAHAPLDQAVEMRLEDAAFLAERYLNQSFTPIMSSETAAILRAASSIDQDKVEYATPAL